MLVSCLLIIFDFAQVKVAQINLLGTNLLIGNPEVLEVIIWFLWAYFLLRYYQFFKEENDLMIFSTFTNHFKELAKNFAMDQAIKHGSKYEFANLFAENTGFLKWEIKNSSYNPAEGNVLTSVTGVIPCYRVIIWHLKSFIHLFLNTSKITEHLVPFIVAFMALIVNLIQPISIFN